MGSACVENDRSPRPSNCDNHGGCFNPGVEDVGVRRFRAPGRVNLMGDHTDYNEGFVLPLALDLACTVSATATGDGRIRLVSAERDPAEVASDGRDEPAAVEPEWARYVAGVARALGERGRPPLGLDGAIDSTVPAGSGLSSSAALEVACALALTLTAGLELDARELALACQRAEQAATGVPSGLMDQLASLCGRAGHALLIDCRDLAISYVPMPASVQVVVVHSGEPRTLARTAYAERRRECEEAAAALGLRSLRDATAEQVASSPRARHVVSENARVLATAQALECDDLDALGPLMAASHASLRDDYEVSTPALDALVDALRTAGALGARLTGAGFGGCVVALALREEAGRVAAEAASAYAEATRNDPRAWLVTASDGAKELAA
jgi:galactokinase